MIPQAQTTKAKLDRWYSTKLKSFYTAKKINTVERQPTEWEKIFANHMSDKGFIVKIHRELINLKLPASRTEQLLASLALPSADSTMELFGLRSRKTI